ncbi:uncharacterized protein A1O5_06826 [Cladophialophora psammophila CBS 110553]|uniref:Zn(2)-C6 fungal-type domain-containing protein n=1 Tax=Cladophialophora psammophila CBS 110553 TaxID=1182543 RepID=W9WXF3_9EURO|nr:uncharacterized protein A1O5_06826 [Cladophialophora psammophila CBS 110553]EXJ69755.1 hypothetical protein A1O5_06826 [Cladophialophora psammophila CBS 110553]
MVAACEACRSLKMRCSRSALPEGSTDTQDPCDRCKHHRRPCKVPTPRPSGRKPGSRGRYHGVEKALRKIQTELRKAKPPTTSSDWPDQANILGLLGLPEGKEEILHLMLSRNGTQSHSEPQNDVPVPLHDPEEGIAPAVSGVPATSTTYPHEPPRLDTVSTSQSPPGNASPDDTSASVSNPLGLVADACGETHDFDQQSNDSIPSLTSEPGSSFIATSGEAEPRTLPRYLLRRPGYVSLGLKLNRKTLEDGLDALFSQTAPICKYSDYFKPSDAAKHRDTGPDLDPVELGLVSVEEVNYLFPLFFERLHPINGILDPLLHTPEFVQSRSALLFTWILAISAQFDHHSGSISKRLRIHGEHLSKQVYANGYKSVEIAQGYYISLLSAVPANTMAEERSWLYTIYAFGVAAELGLDREAQAHRHFNHVAGIEKNYQALSHHHSAVEAFDDRDDPHHREDYPQDADAMYAERLARNRERTWLRILLWERAHSAARGRVSAFPETELTRKIETWHLHTLANPVDKYTCAFIVLRQHLGTLQNELKRQIGCQHASRHWVRELLDSILEPWCRTWLETPDGPAPPSAPHVSNTFLRFVYMHGRLWTLSLALHGIVDGGQDAAAIKADCFEAAVNCCEMAVHDLLEIGEPIYCMLAPTWAMISYSAVLALRLFPLLYGGKQPGNEVELLSLLSQVALQLERAGTTPSHRFGIAALLGQHLFKILRTRANVLIRVAQVGASHSLPAPSPGFESQGLGHQTSQSDAQHFDPFLSNSDPFLTLPFLPGGDEDDDSVEGFPDVLWDWVGHGFVGIG